MSLNKNFIKKIDEIADSISLNASRKTEIGILGGTEGLLLFLLYYSKLKNTNKYNRIIEDSLIKIFETINSKEFNNKSFSYGLAGTGWFIQHLAKIKFLDFDVNNTLSQFDKFLYPPMKNDLSNSEYDYLHKGLGYTLYYLNRDNNNCSFTNEAIELLDKTKIVCKNGAFKWISNRYKMDGTISKEYNISLSHGIASIIGILTKSFKKGIAEDKSKSLLIGAIKYVLMQKNDFNKIGSSFPTFAHESLKGELPFSRLAWCYGDLGIGISLYNASKALNDKKLERESINLLMKCTARRNLEINSVYDAGLCHGSSGIAHIFNRMYLNTRIKIFEETAKYWFDKTIEFSENKDGVAGYKMRNFDGKTESWINCYGFLEGVAGIGLSLISYVSDIPPKWDEILLIS